MIFGVINDLARARSTRLVNFSFVGKVSNKASRVLASTSFFED